MKSSRYYKMFTEKNKVKIRKADCLDPYTHLMLNYANQTVLLSQGKNTVLIGMKLWKLCFIGNIHCEIVLRKSG